MEIGNATVIFFVFDVGMITGVERNQIFVDHKEEGGVFSVSYESTDFNCSITDTPSWQYMLRMLMQKWQTIERQSI